MCILQTVWPHILGVCTVQQFLGPRVGTWWSLDGTTGHTRLENGIEPILKIEDVLYKTHCWLAADVLTA